MKTEFKVSYLDRRMAPEVMHVVYVEADRATCRYEALIAAPSTVWATLSTVETTVVEKEVRTFRPS